MWQRLKIWAARIKADVTTLYLATRDARTSTVAKLLAVLIVAYAISPIDLIPDFIPVLGFLDEVILLPLAIKLALSLIPKPLLDEFRQAAADVNPKASRILGLTLVFAAWCAIIFLVWYVM